MFEPKCLDAFPNLKDFVACFEGLKISAYMKTNCFLPSPVYLKQPTWGNKQDSALLLLLGHAIRLLLEYTETSYEEKRYTMGDAPDYDRSQWLNDKFKLGLDFPNLPYLIDGSHKVTQSNAILRYLGRKHNLCGETEEERVRVDILEKQVMDSRIQMGTLCYSPDFEKRKPEFLKGLPDHLKLYSEFLGTRPWFAGDKITFADFLVYDVLDQHQMFEPKCLDAFPNLKDFVARFEDLKKISAYMKTSRFLPSPVYLKQAMWGNK
ncbi:glutathione S-transferase Mu 6 isoform X1 [Mesocricetus auratus]|uniref:Glutathione S-transferase n=1 Tax=Mesocricetus auratus TaxID=10036 RepID=A0A1U8C288_MESAU|nr:glutathione S-transferase Mu 6 isoform X1 [Mesocricetus auratus]